MKITKVMKGPYLQMRALPNYQEFIYLLNFSDPFCIFEGLKSFPHILYHAMTFGDWNTLIITDLSLDFSQLKGFENLSFSGLKQKSETPKIPLTTWDQSFDHIYRILEEYDKFPSPSEDQGRSLLPWGKREWELFHAFRIQSRKKAAPTLKQMKISYEIYSRWKTSIKDYCTVLLGFYPWSSQDSLIHSFLVSACNKDFLMHLCSHFSVTPVIHDLGEYLLINIPLDKPEIAKKMFLLFKTLKKKEIIQNLLHSVILERYQH
jgi:hypothetical protein